MFLSPYTMWRPILAPGSPKQHWPGLSRTSWFDTSFVIAGDSRLRIITSRDEEGVEVIRHSAAHLLAQAVKLLYPEAQVTIGPVISDGFYYDFAFERPFTPEDLEAIEKKNERAGR